MTLPMDQVRAAFPALALADDGLPRLYLDAPAGTQVAGRVVEAMSRTMIEACANDGGTFRTSVATGAIVEAALAAAAACFNCAEDEVIFGLTDVPCPSLSVEAALANAPAQSNDLILVPKIVE